ncbi:TonB-dependent receptor domain-containing protein, partial [Aliarcobacter butzleri]
SPKDKDGKRLDAAYVPKQTFKIFTNYKYNKLTLGGGINWQSEIYRNAEYRPGTISQKAYAVVNAMAKYEVSKGFDVILNANN